VRPDRCQNSGKRTVHYGMKLYTDLCYCTRKAAGIKENVEHNLGIEITSECTGLTLNLFFNSSQRTGAENS